MFRVLDIAADGALARLGGDEQVAPPPEGVIRWIDLEAQDTAQLGVLAERFQFHPLAIEDCAHFDQRPKLEEYRDYLFLVTHGFRLAAANGEELEALELHTFLAEKYLVTVHAEPIPSLEMVWRRLEREPGLGRRGVDFIYYLIADALVDTFFPLLDDVADEVEQIEEDVLNQAHAKDLGDIFRLKRLMVSLRKVLAPQRDVFALLAKHGHGHVAEAASVYFRDVYDHLLRINESVEATRDLLNNALEAYLWSASQRTNEIMKRLTLLSAVFLPLTFITGFFGQNFDDLPFGSTLLFSAMLASCLLVPAGMLYLFVRSKWF